MSVQPERRRYPRLTLAGRRIVVSPAGQEAPGVVCDLHDVSTGGIRCTSAGAPPGADGRDIEIAFPMPSRWRAHWLRLPARVVRSGPEPSMYAFELTAATESREARQLAAFLSRAAAASRHVLEDQPGIDRQVEEALHMVQLGLPRRDEAGPRLVMLTSPTPGATGFLAAGLALVLAGQGEGVLAVDLDLARPALHRFLGVGLGPGVTDWIRSGATDLNLGGLARSGLAGVRTVPAGDASAGGLACGRVGIAALVERLRQVDAQYVIVNAPACLIAPDAGLLSELADDVLLVLRAEQSSEAEVVDAATLLERHGARVRGVILMDAESGSGWWRWFRWRPFGRGRARRPDASADARTTIARQAVLQGALAAKALGMDESR